jgi:hypothetical protein
MKGKQIFSFFFLNSSCGDLTEVSLFNVFLPAGCFDAKLYIFIHTLAKFLSSISRKEKGEIKLKKQKKKYKSSS